MRTTIFAGLGAAMLLAGSAIGAQAMPLGTSTAGPAPLVEHVAQGCGPGFARGPRGFCRPMGGPRGYGQRSYGPRPFYGRPAYGPGGYGPGGYGPGGYGPRPSYRY